jgi:hypothetical protein
MKGVAYCMNITLLVRTLVCEDHEPEYDWPREEVIGKVLPNEAGKQA